ncbi:hypothetical protein N7G274_010178 [Stereocaulon virgatum]|uniref:Uncharacterized protein n=1 Tax=Stereocaulon virgatum TaxID=373712 RepID=A0ABR3ZWE2_9LECA
MFNTLSSDISLPSPSANFRAFNVPPSVRPSLQSQTQSNRHFILAPYTTPSDNMSSDNTSSTPTWPSEAEIIDFTANTSIPVSFWEPEIIDLTEDDTPKLPHDDSTSATISEPDFNLVILSTEPVSYEEDEASVKSEPWSPTEVDFDYAMGYFASDPMEDDESVTTPAENHSSVGPESESRSPTEADFDFAMGYLGADPELDEDSFDERESMPELEYDSVLGYCGPDRKMMRRAKSCLRQKGGIIDLEADLEQEGEIIDLDADLEQE